MDRSDTPDFLIFNNYGKILHLKMEFEYLDESGMSGETDTIIFNPDEQKPITLRQIPIRNSETPGPIDPSRLNLQQIIISAWVSGSELNTLPINEPPPKQSPKQPDKVEIHPKTGWNPFSQGWNMLSGIWGTSKSNIDESKSPLEAKKEEVNEEIQPYVQLEGCAAIVRVDHLNIIRIIQDPIRDLPRISGEKVNLNDFH